MLKFFVCFFMLSSRICVVGCLYLLSDTERSYWVNIILHDLNSYAHTDLVTAELGQSPSQKESAQIGLGSQSTEHRQFPERVCVLLVSLILPHSLRVERRPVSV